ncbi:MAG: glycosyltransferase family 39 protein [Planctomycetia bacterium]|nr:glycosyltransferase family 39 protein [Planctomycetia bacterium]
MAKSKQQRGRRSASGRLADGAPNGGLGWPLVLVWGWLGMYWALYFASPMSSTPAGSSLLRRWQLWSPMLLPDETLHRWIEGFTPNSITDRATILGFAAAIFCVATATGWICLQFSGLNRLLTRLERFVFSAAAGLNLTSLATLALGLGGWLRLEYFVAAALAIAIVASVLGWRSLKFGEPPRDADHASLQSRPKKDTAADLRLSPAWLWLGVPFLVAIVLSAMLPPLDFDVLEYHLQAPKEFYQAGRIIFLPHNVYANMPLGTEMLSLLGMVVSRDWWTGALVGKTLIACFSPLTALALVAAGRRFVTPAAGVIAALTYISIPWIALVSTQGLVEGGFALYLLLALYAVLQWRKDWQSGEHSTKLLALAGFMAGAAVCCKYPAVVFCVLPLAAGVGYIAILSTRVSAKRAFTAELQALAEPLGIFLLFTVLSCGLWFGKNAVLSGNPSYPLLAGVFDSPKRTPDELERWDRVHGAPNYEFSDLAEQVGNVALRSDWLSPLVMPLAALALVVQSRWRGLSWTLAGYFGFVFLAWWLLTHRIDRFWIPALPIAALLAGIGATWSDSKWWRATLAVIGAAGLAFNLVVIASGELSDSRYLADLDELRVDPARIDPWHRYLNERGNEVTGVLLVGDAQPFDLEVPVTYNTVFDDCIFEQIARRRTPEQVHAELAERNISHVYVAWGEIRRYRSPGNYGICDFIQPGVFEKLLSAGVLESVPSSKDDPGQLFRVSALRQEPH